MKIIKIFFIGIVSAIMALVFEFILSIIFPSANGYYLSSFSWLMIGAIFIEEIFKWAFVWKISQNIQSTKEIFLNSVILGLGFYCTEIFLNLSGRPWLESSMIASYWGLFLVHTITAGLAGYYFSLKKDWHLTFGIAILFLSISLHFLYNIGILYDFSPVIASAPLAVLGLLLIILFLKIPENHYLPSLNK